MRSFTRDELARLQGAQEDAMQDKCELLDYRTTGQDEFGNPIRAYAIIDTVDCGYAPNRQIEVMVGTQVAVTDAQVRLSLDNEAIIDNLSRVRITYRFDEQLASPISYEVIGQASRGPSGLLVNLRLVTDGS